MCDSASFSTEDPREVRTLRRLSLHRDRNRMIVENHLVTFACAGSQISDVVWEVSCEDCAAQSFRK